MKKIQETLKKILLFVCCISFVSSSPAFANCLSGDTETIQEHEVSMSEYRDLLSRDGLSAQVIDKVIREHTILRANPEKLYSVTKSKTKSIKNGFKLKCRATIYVWRDTSTGKNLEIDRVSSARVQVTGHNASNSSFEGDVSKYATKKKVTIDYVGEFVFTVSSSVSVGFGVVSASTGTTKTYRYETDGSFTWKLSEI